MLKTKKPSHPDTTNVETQQEENLNVESQDELLKEEDLTMHRLLTHAYDSLENFVSPNLSLEKQIPIKILNDAYAIIFLTEFKAGFLVGASLGTGIILARRLNEEGKGWTGPCGIGLGGMSVGFQAGMQKTDHIMVLRDEEVLKTFTSKGELKIGGDASFSVGPLGRDANVSFNISKQGSASLYSYSMSKGAYVGASLEGQLITILNDCNEKYYERKVTANDILFGNNDVQPLQDDKYNILCESLNKYINFKQHQVENYSKETNVVDESNVVRVITDVHKEEVLLQDSDKNNKH